MLTRSLARELGPEIRVNGIAPGPVLWPDGGMDEALKQEIIDKTALKRHGTPQDIARTVLFLAKDAPVYHGANHRGGRRPQHLRHAAVLERRPGAPCLQIRRRALQYDADVAGNCAVRRGLLSEMLTQGTRYSSKMSMATCSAATRPGEMMMLPQRSARVSRRPCSSACRRWNPTMRPCGCRR